jgi:exonuclease SbcD
MKILHTADWHLGHYLRGQENNRYDEHEIFLHWLLDTIENQYIELLLIAGDIFDSANPPHWAEEQYYRFLANVTRTNCKNVVIIAGNHDSPNKLNAPKELFKYLNIHVVGRVTDYLQDEIIEIYEQKGKPLLVVCAVPFLKDADIRKAIIGEDLSATEHRIKEGILNHYHQVGQLVRDYKNDKIPILAMGHLFASGITSSESEKEIHVGNQGQIDANKLPELFDYVAFGHIHRPQKVAGKDHIRYSGSPIPLSFSEHDDKKIVLTFDLSERGLSQPQEIPVPMTRPLLRLHGNLQYVENQFTKLQQKVQTSTYKFSAWAEVKVILKEYEPNLSEKIYDFGKKYGIDILKIGIEYETQKAETITQTPVLQSLNELTPLDVFRQKCESEKINLTDEKYKDVLEAFQLLVEELE